MRQHVRIAYTRVAVWTLPLTLACAVGTATAGCGAAASAGARDGGAGAQAPLPAGVTLVGAFDDMPSGVAVVGDRIFVAFPRWHDGEITLGELVDDEIVAYPSAAANDPATGPEALHSVNGLRADDQGRLWIVDNARIGWAPADPGAPKLVVWDPASEREVFRHVFDEEIAPLDGSFLNDIAIDEQHGFAYLTESGIGGTPALVVYDLVRDLAWRALDGSELVQADPLVDMTIDGDIVELHRGDDSNPWRVALNAIALSPDARTVYFGATSSRTLYSIPSEALRDHQLDDDARAALAGPVSSKPITDGIAVAPNGTLYFTDVEADGVRAGPPGEEPALLVSDPRFSFPVALDWVSNSAVYFTSNQLHRQSQFHGGRDRRTPPYFLWRLDPTQLR